MVEATSKFRSEGNNNLLTKGLFFETTLADKSSCLYSLKDRDHPEGYPSLYRLYMETNDPTEYRFATTYLDGWEHWEYLCRLNWFKEYVDRWRKELDLRMKSQALAKIMTEAKTGSKESFSANKYLLEKGWEPKDGSKRGRPSKEEIKRNAEDLFNTNNRLSSDFDRIVSLNRN